MAPPSHVHKGLGFHPWMIVLEGKTRHLQQGKQCPPTSSSLRLSPASTVLVLSHHPTESPFRGASTRRLLAAAAELHYPSPPLSGQLKEPDRTPLPLAKHSRMSRSSPTAIGGTSTRRRRRHCRPTSPVAMKRMPHHYGRRPVSTSCWRSLTPILLTTKTHSK
jgi:hypothetical protein